MHPDHTVKSLSVLSLRSRVSYRGGGDGGDLSPHDFGKGGYPPIKLQNSVFL